MKKLLYSAPAELKDKFSYVKPLPMAGMMQVGCAKCNNEEITDDIYKWKCEKHEK